MESGGTFRNGRDVHIVPLLNLADHPAQGIHGMLFGQKSGRAGVDRVLGMRLIGMCGENNDFGLG